MKYSLAFLVALFVAAGATAQTSSQQSAQDKWSVDKNHSQIGFSVVHMGISDVEGKFNDFEGTVSAGKNDFDGAQVSFTAKTNSVDTDNQKRDAHLKSADFFDAEKYPEIAFKGKLTKERPGIDEKTSATNYKLKGDLTMKGVTKPVEFTVTHRGTVGTGQMSKAGFRLHGEINRQDFGLSWSNKVPTGELVVSDIVTLQIQVELDRKEQTASK